MPTRWTGSRPRNPVASVPRYFDKTANEWKDGEGLFLTVNVWRQQAENVSESVTRGTRVIVTGRLRQRSYEVSAGDGPGGCRMIQ